MTRHENNLILMWFTIKRMGARSTKLNKKNSYLFEYTFKDLRRALNTDSSTWSPKLKADVAKLRRGVKRELREAKK